MGEETSGVGVLLGDQRKGIVTMMVPIAVALLVQQVNSLVDGLWVSDLGGKAMAALGVVNPIYCIITGIGTGLGIGVSSAIARSIGMRNKKDADGVAVQGLILTAAVSLAMTALLIPTAEAVMPLMGGADMMEECLAYAYPTYIMTFFIVLSSVLSGMLRGEGAAKRSMAIQVVGAAVNIVLDPIMIFLMGMGVAGAAWATGISFAVSCIIALYWYLKGSTYASLRGGRPGIDGRLQREILSVGLPEALEMTVMYFFNIFLNIFVIQCGGVEGMAAYTAAWRVAFIMMIPAQAIGGAIVAVCSAEFGMRRFDMITDAFRYSVRLMFACMACTSIAVAVLSGPISAVFMHSEDLICVQGEMRSLLLSFSVFMPMFGLACVGSCLLQAIKKAMQAMLNSLARNIYLTIFFAVAAAVFGTLTSIWIVLALAEVIGGVTMHLNAAWALKRAAARAEPA